MAIHVRGLALGMNQLAINMIGKNFMKYLVAPSPGVCKIEVANASAVSSSRTVPSRWSGSAQSLSNI